jgi:ubiquinone/menaquinone biosynthesis C-methylase UbiE
MLKTLSIWFYRLPRWLKSPVERILYEGISALDREAELVFMNYGWADAGGDAGVLPLLPEDERNRYCIQLYHRVASAVDLLGLNVLEVGCGRGGGASFVKRYLQPKALTGLDRARRAISFCRRHYDTPGLAFVRGDAEALEFDEDTFDAVINVESSHCYGAIDRFLAGVRRVLKPGGHLLFADFRNRADVPRLRRQFGEAGLAVVEEESLNEAVVRALELGSERKQALIKTKVPRLLRPFFHQFAALEGTASVYETLRRGDKQYLRFVLQKG